MFEKPCDLRGHTHTLALFRVAFGTPTRVTRCAARADLDAPPADGLVYFWATDAADIWAFLDVEGQQHPIYAVSARDWAALRAGAPAGGLR